MIHFGAKPFGALKVRSKILKSIQNLMKSQDGKYKEMFLCLLILVMRLAGVTLR